MKRPIKPLLFRLINASGLLAFFALVSTGLVIKYILPHGSGQGQRLGGKGFGGGRPVVTWLGQTRHEWGDWHFYIAAAFFALMLVHFFLNWNWIRAVAWGTKGSPQKPLRKLMTVFIILFIALAMSLPWLIKKEVHPRQETEMEMGELDRRITSSK